MSEASQSNSHKSSESYGFECTSWQQLIPSKHLTDEAMKCQVVIKIQNFQELQKELCGSDGKL